MPRVEDTGLVEVSQMFGAAPDVSQGGGNTLLSIPSPQPGAEVGKQTRPSFPAASRSPSHLLELPTSALVGATDFSAFVPLSRLLTHTLCRGIQIPHPRDGSGVTSSTRRMRRRGPSPGMGDRTEELEEN